MWQTVYVCVCARRGACQDRVGRVWVRVWGWDRCLALWCVSLTLYPPHGLGVCTQQCPQKGSQISSSGMKVPSKKVQTWVGDWTFELEVSLKQTPGTTGWKTAQLEPLCGQLHFSEPLHSHTFDLETWCEFRDRSQPHSHTAVMCVRSAQMWRWRGYSRSVCALRKACCLMIIFLPPFCYSSKQGSWKGGNNCCSRSKSSGPGKFIFPFYS